MVIGNEPKKGELTVVKLNTFISREELPVGESEIRDTFLRPEVKEVRNFVLGPGVISNIPQACKKWINRFGLNRKATLMMGETPDAYLAAAQAITEDGVVPLFWTCAVFGREKDLFFGSATNTCMFFVQQVMPLDHMQLACTSETASGFKQSVSETGFVSDAKMIVASHKSPAPLLDDLLVNNKSLSWQEANSNGAAAVMVKKGEVNLCITTEQSRIQHNLVQLHDYGCPDMVFFGGLTEHGVGIVRSAYTKLLSIQRDKALNG